MKYKLFATYIFEYKLHAFILKTQIPEIRYERTCIRSKLFEKSYNNQTMIIHWGIKSSRKYRTFHTWKGCLVNIVSSNSCADSQLFPACFKPGVVWKISRIAVTCHFVLRHFNRCNFNRLHFQPLAFSTACKFNRHKFDLFN